MGYNSLEEFKGMVVNRMRREVDASKDWDSLISAQRALPQRKDDGRDMRDAPDQPVRRSRVWGGLGGII